MMTVTVLLRWKFQAQNGAMYFVVVPPVTAAEVIGWCTSVIRQGSQDSHGEYRSGYIHRGVSRVQSVVLVTAWTVRLDTAVASLRNIIDTSARPAAIAVLSSGEF